MIFLDHLLDATRGVLRHPGKQKHFDAFSHDTRQLIPGELFVAVRGERSDGHDYLLDAVRRGAAGLLVEGRHIKTLQEEKRGGKQKEGNSNHNVGDKTRRLQIYVRLIIVRLCPKVV